MPKRGATDKYVSKIILLLHQFVNNKDIKLKIAIHEQYIYRGEAKSIENKKRGVSLNQV